MRGMPGVIDSPPSLSFLPLPPIESRVRCAVELVCASERRHRRGPDRGVGGRPRAETRKFSSAAMTGPAPRAPARNRELVPRQLTGSPPIWMEWMEARNNTAVLAGSIHGLVMTAGRSGRGRAVLFLHI